jgi:hypothetical protein
VKLIIGIGTLVVAAAFLLLAVATVGIVAYFVLIPHAQHALATPTPQPTQATMVEFIAGQQAMPTHLVKGNAFHNNQHSVLIIDGHGNQHWTYTGASGEYEAFVKTDAKDYTVTIYDHQGDIVYSDQTWRVFSPSGVDVVNIDSSNR